MKNRKGRSHNRGRSSLTSIVLSRFKNRRKPLQPKLKTKESWQISKWMNEKSIQPLTFVEDVREGAKGRGKAIVL